jgi:hypothetical protein
MSKAKEKAAIQEIIHHYNELRQAAADAKYYHDLYVKEIEATYFQQIGSIQAEYEETIRAAQAGFEREHAAAQALVDQATQALGVIAAPWESNLWQTFDPALRDAGYKTIDPLTGMDSFAGGYGSTRAIPGGVRLGTVVQRNLKKPIKNAPALVPLIGSGHILIVSNGKTKVRALHLLQSIVTRILVTFPILSARAVFIDPLGLGDNFPFKLLPEAIRGNTVYSEPDEIAGEMRELTEHLRRVTLRYLAREFDNIEAYNQKAEEVVEPYRLLAVADFPSKFESDPATRLISVAEKGVRTGVYLLMHVNGDAEMPRNFDFEALKRTSTVIRAEGDTFVVPINGEDYEFIPDQIPDSALFNELMQKIAVQSSAGTFRGIPFGKIAPPTGLQWVDKLQNGNGAGEDTRTLIEVPIGRSGARDILHFWLGQRDGRISAHALVGGKTGSGKSTLFHVLINSLALKYSPDEIELYLIDFKEGVEFKPYADAQLPHARVVAIESERELGLSVLRGIQAELERRGMLFKAANSAQSITAYRNNTGEKLARILLIIDEFQILFSEQDALANKAGQILDDLARRGRGFGIHVIMGSQSVRVANLPNSTFSQFHTRIVLQSPEAEVASLLSPDNVIEAEIIERPGEVIVNDNGGTRGHNTSGQVALLSDQAISRVLERVNELALTFDFKRREPLIVFRGNQASSIVDNGRLEELYSLPDWSTTKEVKDRFGLREWIAAEHPAMSWLGEAIEIKPHTAAMFKRRSRSNLIVVGDNEEIVFGMLGAAFISLAGFYRPGEVKFRIVDLSLKEEEWEDTCEHFEHHFSFHDIRVQERRRAVQLLEEVAEIVAQRQEAYRAGEDDLGPSVYFVVAGAHRFPELRAVPGRYGRDEPSDYATKLIEIIQRGPEVGVHTILWCDSSKTIESILGRPALAHFDRRVALAMSKDDSQYLLSDPAAGSLQRYRAYLLDEEQSVPLEKFKPYALPSGKLEREALIKSYADRLQIRVGDTA